MMHGLKNKYLVLGVAFGWGDRKGYKDCLKLAEILDDNYQMVLVGVTREQIKLLPNNILGIQQTNSQKELAEIYSASDILINTTYEDNYPTVNLEARACGLQVITYKTGGSPESAGENAIIVETGDILGLKYAIEKCIQYKDNNTLKTKNFNLSKISADSKFMEYISIYDAINKKKCKCF